MINGADLLSDSRTAIFSADRTHRFLLKRNIKSWVDTICLFIMLNPSKADEHRNDNTVSRCIKFAEYWGFGKLWVMNIFSICSTDPKALYVPGAELFSAENDQYIRAAVAVTDRVVLACGNHGKLNDRGGQVKQMIREAGKTPMALGLTNPSDGYWMPKHPLARGKAWIPYNVKLIAL